MDPHPSAKPTSAFLAEVQQFTVGISERIVKPRRNALKGMITKVMTSIGLHPERFTVLKKEADIMAYQIELTGVCAGHETFFHLRPHIQNHTSKLDRILSLMEGRTMAQAGQDPHERPSRPKNILSALKRPIIILGLVLATNLAIIAFYHTGNRKAAEREAKEQGLLRQQIEESNLKHDHSLAAINESIGALMHQMSPDVITYQESGGRTYVLVPNGTWKPVTFQNITPAK